MRLKTTAPWLLLSVAVAGLATADQQFLDEPAGDHYRLSAAVTAAPAALRAGEVRLLFDYGDDRNTLYLSLRGEQAQFHRVLDGRDTPLGAAGPLYRGAAADRLEVAVQRQDWALVAIVNQVVCARAEDRSLPVGRVGYRTDGTGLKVEQLELQPTEDIYFADDFMRADEKLGQWTPLTGKWENNQQGSKASRSANAFSFRSLGDSESLAVAGHPFWSDYTFQAAVRSDGTGALGLAVGVIDERHYYRLRWTSAQHADGGTVRLQRVFGGQVTDLTRPLPGGFKDQVWYKVQLALSGGRLFGWIDETPLFEVAVQAFGEGRVGLWTEPGADDKPDVAGALFDDVYVRTWPVFVDDFLTAVPGRWQPTAAPWDLAGGAARATAGGQLVLQAGDWGEVTWSAEVTAGDGQVGLLLHRTADGRALALRCAAGASELVRLDGERVTVLDHLDRGLAPGSSHHLSVSWDNGLVRAKVDHEPWLDAFDLSLPAGRCGLLATGRGASFRAAKAFFRATFWSPPPFLPADFVTDQYMVGWASPGAVWIEAPGSATRWHKGFFYGDRRVSFQVPELGKQKGRVQLVLGAPSTSTAEAWTLEMELATEGQLLTLRLKQGERVAAEARPAVTAGQPELVVELRGRFVLVWLEGRNVLHHAVQEVRR